MYKAVFYKEWIKTRWVIIGLLSLIALLYVYMFLKFGRSIRFAGIDHIWDVIINKNQFLFREIKYIPIIAGITIALFQYIPEVIDKRLKLAIHLPVKEFKIINYKMYYGLAILFCLFTLSILILTINNTLYFASDIVCYYLLTTMPWYLAGFAIYGLVAWICIEPTFKAKVLNIIILLGLISFYFISDFPASYQKSIPAMVVLTILCQLPIINSVLRFKSGKQ